MMMQGQVENGQVQESLSGDMIKVRYLEVGRLSCSLLQGRGTKIMGQG